MKYNLLGEEAEKAIMDFKYSKEERNHSFFVKNVESLIKQSGMNILETLYISSPSCSKMTVVFKTNHMIENNSSTCFILYNNVRSEVVLRIGRACLADSSYLFIPFMENHISLYHSSGKYRVQKEFDLMSFYNLMTDLKYIDDYNEYMDFVFKEEKHNVIKALRNLKDSKLLTVSEYKKYVLDFADNEFNFEELFNNVHTKKIQKKKSMNDLNLFFKSFRKYFEAEIIEECTSEAATSS